MSTSSILKGIITILLGQTLFFKFSAAPESVYIFSTLHLEPYGRIAVAVLELIICIFLWIPKYTLISAIVSLFLMLNAIFLHVFVLGISVQNDNGFLFLMAILTALASGMLIYRNKRHLSR